MNSARYSEVESATRALLARQPSSGILWKLHSASLLEQGHDALHALGRAAELLPDDAEVKLHLGHLLLDRGDSHRAIDHFRRLTALKPQFAEAHDSLGAALLAAGEPGQAAASHRRAIALNPRLAEAHGNLGNALMTLREHGSAVEHYRTMILLQPAVAEAHNNLGNALLSLRRYEEAAASYRKALELRPDALGALLNLGSALREAGRPLEALVACRRVLELRPGAESHRLLGHLQGDLGDLDAAIVSYRRSLEFESGSEESLLGLGKTLRLMGRIDEAETHCRQALGLSSTSGDALTLLAELQADRGQFEEANALLRKAIATSPDLPEAWAALARYRDMQNAEPEWAQAVQRLLAGPLSPAQEINLRYALGKFLDEHQQFDEAFESYRRANALERQIGPAYDRLQHEQQTARIVERYDQAWIRSQHGAGDDSARPVFIVGMPRSGTSLIEQILASHPAAYGAGELRFWHLAAARSELASLTDPRASEPAALAREYLAAVAALSANAERVIDKMPANFMHLGLIHAALPGARIIHVRRDPRDTVLSVYFQAFSSIHAYAHDLDDIAHYFGQYQLLMRHWHSSISAGTILDIDYEALVQEPERWTRRLLEHIGLPWDARCLEFHVTSRTVATASNWQVRQKLNARGVGRSRRYANHLAPLPLAGRLT